MKTSCSGHMVKSPSLKQSITEPFVLKKTVFSMKESLVQPKTGNVIVVNTRESDTEALFVINVVLRSHFQEYVVKDSVTLRYHHLLHTFGISKEPVAHYHFCLMFLRKVL